MRPIIRLIPLGTALLLGCSPAPAPAPVDPPISLVLNLKQFMEWVLDPAADVIWDSVKTIITEAGTKEIAPQTDEQWAAVRTATATLTASGNMLINEGRTRNRQEWVAAASGLVSTADQALKAAEAKNVEALFNAGGEIFKTCNACHQQYAKHLTSFTNPPSHGANPIALALDRAGKPQASDALLAASVKTGGE